MQDRPYWYNDKNGSGNSEATRSLSWTVVDDFQKYWGPKYGGIVSTTNGIYPGNPVFVSDDSHVAICVGQNSSGTPIIDGHTRDVYHQPIWDGYADYYLPTSYGTTYDLTLVKQENKWLVAQVIAPYDTFDMSYIEGSLPFDLDSKKADFDQFLIAEASAIKDLEVNNTNLGKAKGNRAASSKTYNASTAIEYAKTYSSSNEKVRNDAFIDYGKYGGDCMSFASQCIYAGLGGSWSTPDVSYMDKSNSTKWYYDDFGSWCSCSDFLDYLNGDNPKLKTNILNLAAGKDIPSWSTFEAIGCVGLVTGSNGTEYGHAIFIVDAASPARKDWYYCAHTDEAKNEKVSARYGSDPMYLISPISLD